jgi:regulator of sigma E protease
MLTKLGPILAPFLVFGLVVFIHELGHFIAAKLCGVYAPVFSLGWGSRLWGKRVGETDYRISWLPIGGFVSMASKSDETMVAGTAAAEDTVLTDAGVIDIERHEGVTGPRKGFNPVPWDPNAMVPFGPRLVPRDRWVESKPLLARVFILIAGVTMNVVLALVVTSGVYARYGRPYLPAVVDSVVAGKPAALAGLRSGDSIVAVNGAPVREWSDVLERVSHTSGSALTLRVARGAGAADRSDLTMTPESTVMTDPITGEKRTVGRIGVLPRGKLLRQPLGLGESIREGSSTTWAMGTSIVGVVRGLFTGTVAVSNLGGPIAIARTSVAAARNGMEELFLLLAFVSINIAVLNMLPIPILDGGQIVINVLEAVKGSAFTMRTREYILRAGIVFVMLLFVLVMFNDIKSLFSGLLRS